MNRLFRISFAGMVATLLASCQYNSAMLTEVHADGSLDKTIILESKDPYSLLGIDSAHGWEVKVEEPARSKSDVEERPSNDHDPKVTARKHFSSAAAANAELAVPNDTLFRVASTFEKKFRWFYTYLYYADTYLAVNRLSLPIDDYLTPEDYAFIDRLPAEGARMSRADSLYLADLNRKLIEVYGGQAFFDMYYSAAEQLLKCNNVASAWLDVLHAHKRDLLHKVLAAKEVDEDFMVESMDSLGIPLPAGAEDQFKKIIKPAERVMSFISTAHDGKYQHAIKMPGHVVRTNADSTVGNTAFWSPPSIRFLVKDYTMYAETRQMNYWAVAVSVALIGFTAYLLWRKTIQN